MRPHLDVLVRRGSVPESRHRVQAAVCDATGRLVDGTADAALVTTWRSAAKPFQLLPLVERGHAERWGFDDRQLALMAASHTGSAEHVEIVKRILARIGREPGDLACGYHDPADAGSLEHLRAHPDERTALYNNCSGKHAGMLAMALAEGWPVAGYHHAEHPLQRLILRTVAELSGVGHDAIGLGIDGCSVPVFGLPLAGMATAYARLAAARPDGDARERALARIRGVMSTHPHLTEGHGRFSTELMLAGDGRFTAKVGAEGLECVAWAERGLGVAVKSEDGAGRATEPATLLMLERIGALGTLDAAARERLERFRRPTVRNVVGLEVGSLEARFEDPAPRV